MKREGEQVLPIEFISLDEKSQDQKVGEGEEEDLFLLFYREAKGFSPSPFGNIIVSLGWTFFRGFPPGEFQFNRALSNIKLRTGPTVHTIL